MLTENFTKFMKYYGKGRKVKFFGFFILSLIAGGLEFVGIAFIYPFILLIIKPEIITHTKYYATFSAFSHSSDVLTNAFIFGFIVIFLFIFKNVLMISTLYLQNKFISNWKLAISNKFMHYYLFSPYKDSLKTSPSEKFYNLGSLIGQTLDGFIIRIIQLITNTTIVAMVLGFLFIKFPFAAIATCIFIICSMNLHNKLFKQKIREISIKYLKTSVINNERTLESINNIKEIKILSAENYFYDNYITSQKDFFKILFENTFYNTIQPYIIEIMGVLSLFILGGIISIQNLNNTPWMVASYAVIVAAIFRIAPALNRIQLAINTINLSRDFVKTLILEYENNNLDFIEEKHDIPIQFKNNITLKNVSFTYSKTPVIKDLNLEIKKGEFIGIIGLSGAGKSTLADILMGLLPIDNGEIFVDNLELNQQNFSALRKLVGYVPQQINILDGSFRRNVAWGIDESNIDEEKVIESLKMAQLYDFVCGFENGINSDAILGSTGLSQGQKQRLAIARALYRDPQILILDEATSSLDVETEYEITQMLNTFKTIKGPDEKKTIIAIAHRLSTLKSCDRLIYLKDGRIVDTGTFEELSNNHPDFENLIRLSSLNSNT